MNNRIKVLLPALVAVSVLAGPLSAQDREREARVFTAAPSGWIGLRFEPGSDSGNGRAVAAVSDGSPADEAGLRAGDRILLWNGRPDVIAAIEDADLSPGDRVDLRIARNGQADFDVSVVAAERNRIVERVIQDGREVIVVRPDEALRAIRINSRELLEQMDSVRERIRVITRDQMPVYLEELEDIRIELDGRDFEAFRVQRPELDNLRRDLDDLRVEMPDVREIREQIERAQMAVDRNGDGLAMALTVSRTGIAGAQFANVSPDLGEYFGTDSGVLVIQVAPGTVAADAGLLAGDVIVEAAGEPVADVADLRRRLGRTLSDFGPARPNGAPDSTVQLVVLRRGARTGVTIGG